MLGDILRTEREKRGLTIKDIEQETSIRSIYIEAIENGNYKALPGAVYARGFVRNYAQLLELDADAIVQQFREETEAAAANEQPKQEVKEVRTPRQNSLPRREKSLFASGEDFHERVEKSHRTQNLIVVAALVVIGFVGAIFYFFGEDNTAKQTAANESAKVATQKEQPIKPKQDASTAVQQSTTVTTGEKNSQQVTQSVQQNSSAAVPVNGEISVAAKFTKSCWTQVIADGKTIYEGTIEPGQTFNWQGKNMVTVLAGNAGAVRIAYNGKDLGSLGKDGEVVEKRFTKDKAEDVK